VPSIESIINDILKREGPATNDPNDHGGPTAFGISKKANPEAWADGKVTEAEAREIYARKYVDWPGFNQIHNPYLKAQLVDFGVNSGPQLAIMKLQEVLGVDVDGIIGPQTLSALDRADDRHTNNGLVAARIKMMGRIVKRDVSQLTYLNGWLNRALEFLL
jgi:lysozyme family protein